MVLMLSGDVNLPTIGPVSKRGLVFGGGAAAAVVGFLWWRRKTTAPPAGTDTTGDLTDPGTGDLTGGAADTGVFGPSAGPVAGTDLPAGSGYVTNAQWTQAAENALSGTVDPAALSAALGKYITGGVVVAGSADESLIDQAISVAGYPPVEGSGGYPPAIRTQPAGGQTGPTTLPTPAAPHPTRVTKTLITVATAAVPGANLYGWYVNGSGLGWTGSPSKTILDLQPGHTYEISVQARHNDTYSPHSAPVTVKTPTK